MLYENRVKSSHQAMMGRMLLACFTVAIMSASTEAQLFYDFVESPSGDVLATLELSSLPATLTEVVGLTFTPEGEALFGLGPVYLGDFDDVDGDGTEVIDDLEGGLAGDGVWVTFSDWNPPYLDETGNLYENMSLRFMATQTEDRLRLDDLFGDDIRVAAGDWRLIPEPSSLSLIGVAVHVGTGMGRRRKR